LSSVGSFFSYLIVYLTNYIRLNYLQAFNTHFSGKMSVSFKEASCLMPCRKMDHFVRIRSNAYLNSVAKCRITACYTVLYP